MEPSQNEHVVRSFYAAANNRDVEGALRLLTDDVVMHIAGASPIGGDHVGKDQAVALVGRVLQETQGTFRTELLDILANETYVVTRHRWTAQRNGRSAEMNNFNVYRLTPEGQIAERWEFIADDAAHDEFWS